MTPEGAEVSGFLRPQAERVLGARGAAPRRLHSTHQRRLPRHTTPTEGTFSNVKHPAEAILLKRSYVKQSWESRECLRGV